MELPAHLPGFSYGLAAAVCSLAVFYLAGLLVTPARWQGSMRWPDAVVLGLTLYVVICRVAISSRNIPLKFIPYVLAAIAWIAVFNRLRSLGGTLTTRLRSREARRWLLEFSLLYVLAYVLAPSAGPAFLPLGPGDNLTLVTYARYARQLFESGTTGIELAPFDYLQSPASMYVLAWQSLMFQGDPLQAAMPALLLLASLFGMVVAETARTACGLTHRGSMAIACVVASAPLFRWLLGAYGIAEVLAAIALLYVLRGLARAAADRSAVSYGGVCVVVGGILLMSTVPPPAAWGQQIPLGIAALLDAVSWASLLGLPARIPAGAELLPETRLASVFVLALVPVLLAAIVRAARGVGVLDWPGITEIDRRLARALVAYAVVALTLGNVVVYAVSRPRAARRPAEWRQLEALNNLPFRALTLKVLDEPGGLSTALVMYFLPGRKAQVFGRGISPQDLSFDSVSKEQPLFIQNFSCDGAGHRDTVFVREVGCLLMAPPGMALDTSYPFNQTFLFVASDRMTAREPGGRWNTGPTLSMRVTADPERTPLDRELFLNILVNPFLPEGTKPQRLVVNWGAQRRGEPIVGQREWFSLPVRRADWTGNRVWTLPIRIDFPDGRTILFHEISLTELPRGTPVG